MLQPTDTLLATTSETTNIMIDVLIDTKIVFGLVQVSC